MPRSPWLATLLLLASPAVAAAQPLDAESTTPYLWRVVIQTRPHPLLTPAFRDQLHRDLLSALRPGLGPLGRVEIIDLAGPLPPNPDALWQQFADRGFSALDPDPTRELTGVKTHFLRVAYRDGAYSLEARQHDGFTGLASPVVRRYTTRAPEMLGRAAGLLLDRDFGLTGTVDPPAPGELSAEHVRVRFKAGQLGPLDRFVQPGDVLAVAAIRRADRASTAPARTATGKVITPKPGAVPSALHPLPRDFTLLRVINAPQDGACTCAVLTRYKTAMPASPEILGYRCVRLATAISPITVRLVNSDGQPHRTASQFLVRATASGFTAQPEDRDNLPYDNGLHLFRSDPNRPLAHVACITVEVGARAERFPVPVLGPEPITLRFELDEADEERAVFERACLAVASRAADARTAQAATFDVVAKLIEARKNADALARARAGFEAAEAADKGLGDEVRRLREQVAKSPRAAGLLDAVDRQLASLRQANTQLAERVKDLDGVVKRAADPTGDAVITQAEEVNVRIRLLLARGDVDEALNAYDLLVTLLPDNAEVKERRDRLRQEWKPRSEAHTKARDFLLRNWPLQLTIPDMRDNLPALRAAVQTCKAAGDRYTFRKLLSIFAGTAAKLNDLVRPTDMLRALDPAVEADRKLLADAKSVREALAEIEQDVQKYLQEQDH